MSRFLVFRSDHDDSERLVEESSVPTEAALHEVLMRHPSLVPATDLGLGRVATVGFEVSLASGSADLVMLDEHGRICLVEVKKEGNPDTRRVVAQLLDYASALWGLTIEAFESNVLRRKLGNDDPRTLREFISDELLSDGDDPEDASERTLEGLAETLRTGAFLLVVAAPIIPDGVQRVIEYLNARGLSVYGLEVSYFAGEVECFVPRIVVRPTLSGRIAGQDPHTETAPFTDPQSYVESRPEVARNPIRKFIEEVHGLGGELEWRNYGPRVRVRGPSGPKVVASLDADYLWLTVGPRKGLAVEPGRRAAQRLRDVPGANVGPDYGSIRWSVDDAQQIQACLQIASDLVRELAPA